MGTWNGTNHGTSSGSVTRNTTVNIYGGTIYNNVYGGGAMATVGPPKIGASEFASADWSKCTVNIYGGTIGNTTVYDTHKYGGTVYGGSRGDRGGDYHDLAEGETIENYATVLWTEVNINGGSIAGNVYGGARGGQIKKDTKVNLKGGRIYHNAYGGGRGTTAIAADVLGNTTTELNKGVADNAKGCIVHKDKERINDKYAKFKSMEGGYTVSNYTDDLKKLATTVGLTSTEISAYETAISGAVGTDAQKVAINNYIEAIADKKYDVLGVYGGGDLAMYEPTDPNENTEVIIDGCDVTSIEQMRHLVVVTVKISMKKTASGMRILVPMWDIKQLIIITPQTQQKEPHKEILIPLLQTMMQTRQKNVVPIPVIIMERVLPI